MLLFGVEWGELTGTYTTNATASGSQGLGSFTANMTPLNAGTTYYYRAMAYNVQGWGYGGEMSFTTYPVTPPVVLTIGANDVNPTYATLQGTLSVLGSSTYLGVFFQYGTTTSYGSTTTEDSLTAIGDFSKQIFYLSYGTTYHFRAIARYGLYYAYGGDATFTTPPATGSSTSISIVDAKVFKNYITSGDLLVVMEAKNNYTNLYPNQNASEHFTMQLLATNNIDILGASPLSNWGDRPSSIYFNPTVAASLTQGASYYVKLIGDSISGNATTQYQLQTSDWKGFDLTKLDSWCIGTAINMSVSDGVLITNYVESRTGQGNVITDAAGAYFTIGIPSIEEVRPNLFATSRGQRIAVAGISNNIWDKEDSDPAGWRYYFGTGIAHDIDIMALPFGLTGKDVMAGLVIIVMIGFVMLVVGNAQVGALGALLVTVPILWLGTEYRAVPFFYIMMIVLLFGGIAIRQFIVKTL